MKLQYKILCVFTVILLSIIGCSDDRSLEEKFDDIELGMSYDEVRDIMGEPDDAYSTGTTWHYYISPTPSRTGDLLLILFIKGIVIQKQRLSQIYVAETEKLPYKTISNNNTVGQDNG